MSCLVYDASNGSVGEDVQFESRMNVSHAVIICSGGWFIPSWIQKCFASQIGLINSHKLKTSSLS